MSKSTPEDSSPALVETKECQNCDRRFVGDYCPSCGQEANPSHSVLGVLSVFFRELIDIEGGLWATMWALSSRPGRALALYIGGARRRLMHPGRYLLAAIVVAFGTDRAFTWLGMRETYDERASGDFPERKPQEISAEMANEVQSLLVSTADLVFESQWFLIATNLLLTVLFGLIIWRLFRDKFERLPQAVAFSAFVVAHTVFLETAAELLYAPIRYLSTGSSTGLPTSVSAVVTAIYVMVATVSTFGGRWKTGVKGLLALSWAAFEQMLILGVVIGGYVTWVLYGRLGGDVSSQGWKFQVSISEATAVTLEILPVVSLCLAPLLVHLGFELYYRHGW